jgi:hypothetical protein
MEPIAPVVTNFYALPAPVSVLLLLGTVALLLLCFTGAAIVALTGRRGTAGRVALSGVALAALYAATLVATGFAAKDRIVPAGGGKAFCEIDCHIVYTTASAGFEEASAGRRLAKIRLVALFDARTISPTRGNSPLTQNPREVVLVDASGRRFGPLGGVSALTQALRPGESVTADLSFEIPKDATGLRLLVTEPLWPTHLLIGHENAPFSGKAYFALPG